MRLEIDTTTPHSAADLRAAAAFLLTLCGDISLESVEAARKPAPTLPDVPRPPFAPNHPPIPDAPVPPAPPAVVGAAAPVAWLTRTSDGQGFKDPTPPSNVLPFPQPPAAASTAATVDTAVVGAAAPVAASGLTNPPGPPTEPASASESHEYDSAGMPWDGRIHQKGKSKKKDGTWKLQKGIDIALVQSVTTELAKAKLVAAAPNAVIAAALAANPTIAAAPTPPAAVIAAVPLPPSNPVPVLPQSDAAGNNGVPMPPATAALPVPEAPAVGGVPAADQLISRCVAATVAKKLTPIEVRDLLQRHGCPGLQMVSQMANLIPAITAELDMILAAKG